MQIGTWPNSVWEYRKRETPSGPHECCMLKFFLLFSVVNVVLLNVNFIDTLPQSSGCCVFSPLIVRLPESKAAILENLSWVPAKQLLWRLKRQTCRAVMLFYSPGIVLENSMIFNYSGWSTDPEVLSLKLPFSELFVCLQLAEIKSQNVLNLLIMDVG